MQFTNILAVAVLLAGSALAAPAADANPPKAVKPSKPASTTVAQSNNCGNTATPYCCDSETLSALTTCSILGKNYFMAFFNPPIQKTSGSLGSDSPQCNYRFTNAYPIQPEDLNALTPLSAAIPTR